MGWQLNQSPMANDLISGLCNEVFLKTYKDGVQRASGLVNMWRCQESGVPGESVEGP